MDVVSWLFIFLIVLVSGGIAVFADWLGRRFGKRRLTLGKLRPKTTAQLATFVSGIVISAITIGLVSILSADVRDWIRQGRQAIVALANTQEELAKVLREVDRQRAALDRQKAEGAVLNRQNIQLEKDAKSRREQLARQQREIQGLERAAGDLRKRLADFRGRFEDVRRSLSAARTELVVTRQESKVELRKANETLQEANRQLEEIKQQSLRLDQTNRSLEVDIERLKTQVSQLETQRADLISRRVAAEEDIEKANSRLAEAQEEVRTRTRELAQLDVQLANLQRAVREAGLIVNATRLQPLTFGAGEELVRLQVPGNLSIEQARASLQNLLREGRELATLRGAKPRGPDYPAAGIFERTDPQTNRVFSTAELEERLADQISGKPFEQVILAFSSFNAFVGEPVSLEIAVFPNPVIYRLNEVVAETRVDGRRSEAEIYTAVAGFMRQNLRDQVVKDKMVPKVDRDGSIGQVEPADVFRVVRDLKVADRVVRLQVFATHETRAGDPLRIDFRIR